MIQFARCLKVNNFTILSPRLHPKLGVYPCDSVIRVHAALIGVLSTLKPHHLLCLKLGPVQTCFQVITNEHEFIWVQFF